MDIKGPKNLTPSEINQQSARVEPVAGARSPANTASTVSQSVLLKLSPSLFQLGQLLDVMVAKVEKDTVTLLLQNRINGPDGQPLNLQFKTPKTVDAQLGQRLTVQVANLKNNIPDLRVINAEAPKPPLNQMIAQAEARQRPSQTLFDTLAQVRAMMNKIPDMPANIQEKAQVLWRALPDANAIQKTNQIKQAIQYAGPFLENRLATNNSSKGYPGMDVKTNLLRLAEAIRHAPLPTTSSSPAQATAPAAQIPQRSSQPTSTQPNPNAPSKQPVNPDFPSAPVRQPININNLTTNQIIEVLREQVDGSLQRTLTQQLHMLNSDHTRPPLVFEIPIRQGDEVDVFDFRLHSDPEGHADDDPETQPWTIMLAFNLEELGPIRVQLNYQNQQISTHWWAEQQHTVSLFQEHIDHLRNRLNHIGIEIDKANCQLGIPEPNTSDADVIAQKIMQYSDVDLDEEI